MEVHQTTFCPPTLWGPEINSDHASLAASAFTERHLSGPIVCLLLCQGLMQPGWAPAHSVAGETLNLLISYFTSQVLECQPENGGSLAPFASPVKDL